MKMKMSEFESLCGHYNLDPALVLENENVTSCLIGMRDTDSDSAYSGYRNALITALETEF